MKDFKHNNIVTLRYLSPADHNNGLKSGDIGRIDWIYTGTLYMGVFFFRISKRVVIAKEQVTLLNINMPEEAGDILCI